MSEVRRNQWGQYLVLPPGGTSPIGYVRATTVAKTLDDGGGLAPWKSTATVVGALRRPGLLARWQALMAVHPDPWYSTAESKKNAKRLVEECMEAGGSTDRADLGTALHAIIEQRNLGRPGTPILQQHLQADVDAYAATIDAAGITFNSELLEAMVVLDEHRVAGTADLLEVDVPGHGRMVGDLKTGSNLEYSWQSIAVQLATYAHADNVYIQGEAADGSQDRRLPMPELSQQWGLVIHLPAGEARCDLYLVDLVAGWDAFERSMWTRQWRQRKTLARLYTPGPVEAPPAFDEPTQTAGEEAGHDPTPPVVPASSPVLPDFDAPASTQTAVGPEAASLASEVRGVTQDHQAGSEPPPFNAPEALEQAQSTGAPAPADGQPAVEPARPTPPPFDSPQPDLGGERSLQEIHAILGDSPDDGEPGDEAAYLALQKAYAGLPAEVKAWFAQLTDQSTRHRCSFHSHGARTVRRFEIIRGLIELATAGGFDDESIRCVLAGTPALIEPDVAHDPRLEPGHLLGSLDAARAAEFAQRAARLAAGNVAATVRADGRVLLDFNDLAALAA